MQTSGDERREIAKLYPPVIASAAKQSMSRHKERMDCFASLAMTASGEVSCCVARLKRRSIRGLLPVEMVQFIRPYALQLDGLVADLQQCSPVMVR